MSERWSSVGQAPSPDVFREVLGRFATGVSIMTTVVDGVPHGMTANALASVSLDPPLVLVCVERSTVMAERVLTAGVFALSFLASDQAELSIRFADPQRPEGAAQFAGVMTTIAATGAPVFEGGVGWLDCRVWASYEGGDHVIVVGEVLDLGSGQRADPLVYYRSGYGTMSP